MVSRKAFQRPQTPLGTETLVQWPRSGDLAVKRQATWGMSGDVVHRGFVDNDEDPRDINEFYDPILQNTCCQSKISKTAPIVQLPNESSVLMSFRKLLGRALAIFSQNMVPISAP